VQRYFPFMVFTLLTALIAWSLQRALKTGKIQDKVWHWDAEQNPTMFNITFVVWCCVLMFVAAEAVHHLGLIGDPIRLLRGH
jgi:ribose/xylose/arabinose/galactoside ABC-type transport system permease subunit